MGSGSILRVEINGRAATAEQLHSPALVNYGHFTAMQVRGGRARGMALHLARLDAATRELFGDGLDGTRVRDHIRHALGDEPADASVQVNVFWPEGADAASVMVTVRPPADMPSHAHSLRSVVYERPLAHIKHVGGFAQRHYRRVAQRHGYDEALLIRQDGVISEGAVTNIGFFDGNAVVWPDAPALQGITMQLLERSLAAIHLPSHRSEIRLSHLPACHTVFVANSTGVAPVARIDDLPLPIEGDLMKTLVDAYESMPWDTI